jgi:nucleoid DNA-binding protein
MKITKASIVAQLNNKDTNRFNASEMKIQVDTIFRVLANVLVDEGALHLTQVFSMKVVEKAARPGRNVKTGEPAEISERRTIRFKRSSFKMPMFIEPDVLLNSELKGIDPWSESLTRKQKEMVANEAWGNISYFNSLTRYPCFKYSGYISNIVESAGVNQNVWCEVYGILRNAVQTRTPVEIRHFGSFFVKTLKSMPRYNPSTGERLSDTGERKYLSFRPSKKLLTRLNQRPW